MRAILDSLLQDKKLHIADIGAMGEGDKLWQKWLPHCHLYTFNPDPRAGVPASSAQHFPLGVWSHHCSETLHLASLAASSSLFQTHPANISPFLAAEEMKEVGTRRIDLYTLEQCVRKNALDFIKIDAEGSELEVLKGATHYLENECLGVQIKTLFAPIRKNAPLFGDVESYMRQFDFQIFSIQREQAWRTEEAPYNTSPQLVWGNILYLLPKKALLKKLHTMENPRPLFGKYLLILLAHRLFDYAYEICETFSCDETLLLRKEIQKFGSTKKQALRLALSLLAGSSQYALALSKAKKQKRLHYLKRKLQEASTLSRYGTKTPSSLIDP